MINNASESAGLTAGGRALISIAPKRKRILVDPFAFYFIIGRFKHSGRLLKYIKYYKMEQFFYPILKAYSHWVVKSPNGAFLIALRHRYIDEK